MNAIVDDGSGIANFTIFGRLTQELIRVPTQNVAIAINSDKFTPPPMIKTIINQKHIFQIMPDAQKFKTNIPSFKVLQIFTVNNDPKGKEQDTKKILQKSEDQIQLLPSPNRKQIETELSEEPSPPTATSSR